MSEDRDVLTCRARDDWFCSVEQHEDVVASLTARLAAAERDRDEAREVVEVMHRSYHGGTMDCICSLVLTPERKAEDDA